jgi:hypothetical protein
VAATSIAIIWLGVSIGRRLAGIIFEFAGLLLLISVFWFVAGDLRAFGGPNPYDLELLGSVSIGSEKYRLYSTDSGGVGAISYNFLRRERDTQFGFKLVKTLWASSYFGPVLKLRAINHSTIEISGVADGKIVAVIQR